MLFRKRLARLETKSRQAAFAGYADSVKERCPSGSVPAFLRRRRGRPDRIVGSPGGPGVLPGIGRVPHGRPDRPGANGALCMSGSHVLPEPATLLSPQALPGSLPSPCFARARRCPPSSASLSLKRSLAEPHPASAWARPLSGCCPEPALCAQSPPLSSLSSALRGCVLAGRKRRSLAAYLARYGEHGSHLRGLMR